MMQPKTYAILDRAIEDGIRYGINRAIKYERQVTDEQVIDEIRNSIMSEICMWFDIETNNVHSD